MIPNLAAFPHAWFHSLSALVRLLPLGLLTLFLNACLSQPASQSARVSVSPRLSQPASQSARVSVSLRLSQPASQLEAMGITLALDVDFDLGDDTSQPVITSTNDAPFTLSGDCGEAGGAIEWIEPASDTQETVCGSDQRWSITLDRSGFADQVFDFKFRDPRADGSRSIEVEAPSCFKISQGRAPFACQPSSSGVNPAQSGSTAAVRSS